MIGLGSTVLVRFLVKDDPAQTAQAREVIQHAASRGEPCFVSELVVCEVVRILATRYEISRPEIARLLQALFSARELLFASPERLHRVLGSYQAGPGDFSDYLILEQARDAGSSTVVTFRHNLLQSFKL